MGGAVSGGGGVDSEGEGVYQVMLNVYDLTPLNKYFHWCGLGIFHSAVEGFRYILSLIRVGIVAPLPGGAAVGPPGRCRRRCQHGGDSGAPSLVARRRDPLAAVIVVGSSARVLAPPSLVVRRRVPLVVVIVGGGSTRVLPPSSLVVRRRVP
ncbi:hypothetical protein GUJ93_ZPchr0006g41269 [Zizania palustris]|uniref:Uncharacterized protein n=1 Tax=Zizania palustris TaxID=103762 RepID=A0A8J5T602_ZIZPA|nr:hypothetical protein GUJ93_ZPchr0006g41269 [Zizania palustris]